MSKRQRKLKKLGSIRRYHDRAIISTIIHERPYSKNNIRAFVGANAVWCGIYGKSKRRTPILRKMHFSRKHATRYIVDIETAAIGDRTHRFKVLKADYEIA